MSEITTKLMTDRGQCGPRKGLNWYSQYCYDTRHGNRFIDQLDTNQLKRRHPLATLMPSPLPKLF